MGFLRKNVRWIMLIVVVLFVVSCFAGYGMYSPGSSGSSVSGDYPVARIDGERIMRSQVEREMLEMIQGMGLTDSVTSDDYPALRSTVLDQIAVTKELDKEVKSRKISVSKNEIDEAVGNIESQFPTREIYLQQMQTAGMDERGLRSAVEEQILRQKVFDDITSGVSTDEQEKQGFYDTLKSYAFQKPEGFNVNVAHFATEELAEKAKGDIDAGKVWDSVMEAASADVLNFTPYDEPLRIPLAQLTGEVEFIKSVDMNKISKVIKLGDADYLIAIKRSKEEASTSSYEEVSSDVGQMLINQKRQSLQSDFLQELRTRANIEFLDQSIFSAPEPEVSGDESEVSPDVGSPDSADVESLTGETEE
ncbi:MAG: SurA N-terminal domain-containing protein [Synergistaceae bacterium]|nr:SurA N-terminal domain-containing protein [Synergistaceae bacterium]